MSTHVLVVCAVLLFLFFVRSQKSLPLALLTLAERFVLLRAFVVSCSAYANKYGYTLLKAMEKELSGNAKDGCLYVIGMKLKPYETMAQLIKTACAGFGTDELLLTCSIIRFQGVLAEVMSAHIELYGKTIHDRVRNEVGGKFKALLLQILNTAWPEQG
jgi:Annexin